MKLGIVGRFRPPHKGSAQVLDDMCKTADRVVIGVGSSNRYNYRCPFTAEETEEMIRTYLDGRHTNFEIAHIPDSGHIPGYEDGKQWVNDIKERLGTLDGFVTGNPYVAGLLKEHYRIIEPESILTTNAYTAIHGTPVRMKIAMGGNWEMRVPNEVVKLIKNRGWDQRIRREFGQKIQTKGFFLYTNAHMEQQYIMTS